MRPTLAALARTGTCLNGSASEPAGTVEVAVFADVGHATLRAGTAFVSQRRGVTSTTSVYDPTYQVGGRPVPGPISNNLCVGARSIGRRQSRARCSVTRAAPALEAVRL